MSHLFSKFLINLTSFMVKMTVNGVFIECKKIRYQVSYQIEFITQIALYKQHVLLIQMSTPLSIMVVFGVNDIKPARHLNNYICISFRHLYFNYIEEY